MKKLICPICVVLAVAACALMSMAAGADNKTLVLQPRSEGKDAYVCECKMDTNSPNGGQTVLHQGQYTPTCYDRLLLEWDLSSLPKNIDIVSAKMEMYCSALYGAKEGRMIYCRILEAWDEDKVTFNTQPKYTEEGGILADWPNPDTWLSLDITAFVRGWYKGEFPNHGIYGHCVKKTDSQCVVGFIPSHDAFGMLGPKLTIVYR